MCQERKPHKHAELIKAWADGAELQERNYAGKWVDIGVSGAAICWSLKSDYRIKPKGPIVRYAHASYTDYDACSTKESLHNLEGTKTHWTKTPHRTDNIKATFCPDTGKLLSVEMIQGN